MFLSSIFGKKYYSKKIFTYYIPAPPHRKNGYQEKEFDSLVEHIQQLGFDLIDFKMQAHSTTEKSGLWVLCILGAKTKEIYSQNIEFDFSTQSQGSVSSIPLDPSIIHD